MTSPTDYLDALHQYLTFKPSPGADYETRRREVALERDVLRRCREIWDLLPGSAKRHLPPPPIG